MTELIREPGLRPGTPWSFAHSLKRLQTDMRIVTEAGGINALLAEWDDSDVKLYLNTATDIRERLAVIIPALEARLARTA